MAKRAGCKGILVMTGGGKGSLGEYRYTWNASLRKNLKHTLLVLSILFKRMILIIRATQNSTKTCFFYNSTLIVHSFSLGIIKLQNKSAVYL